MQKIKVIRTVEVSIVGNKSMVALQQTDYPAKGRCVQPSRKFQKIKKQNKLTVLRFHDDPAPNSDETGPNARLDTSGKLHAGKASYSIPYSVIVKGRSVEIRGL